MAAVTRREYSGNAPATTLSSDISNSATSIPVTDGTGYPTGTNPFFIVIGRGTTAEEKILCSSRTGNTITASSRGADDTSAASHDAGEAVEHVWTAQDADDVNKVAAALTTKGDLLGFSTEPDRVPVGADDTILVADSTDAQGAAWKAAAAVADIVESAVEHANLSGLTTGDPHTQYAKLAGDTFTGSVVFNAGADAELAADTHAETAAQSAWPDGLSWQQVTTAGWPASDGWVATFNFGSQSRTTQLFFDPGSATEVHVRRWNAGASTWTGWWLLTAAQNPGAWEVDGSTEVASATTAAGPPLVTEASVTLAIPSDWGSWKCEAYATCAINANNIYSFAISIDGTAQQTLEGIDGADLPVSVGGRRTGMTTTGNRTVAFQAYHEAGSGSLADIYLYARAVRTS